MQPKILAPISAVLILLIPTAAASQEKQVANKNPNAVDVVTTPLTDLNIKKGEIPQKLIDAESNPYNLDGLDSCSSLIREVQVFDTLLGDDIDLPHDAPGGPNAGKIGQAAVGMFIPFRGVIRQVSGANKQQKKLADAILAGQVRRGFLKGIGQTRNCSYPARPASEQDVSRIRSERANAKK